MNDPCWSYCEHSSIVAPRRKCRLKTNPNLILLDFREHNGDAELWLDEPQPPMSREFIDDIERTWEQLIRLRHHERAVKVLTQLDALRKSLRGAGQVFNLISDSNAREQEAHCGFDCSRVHMSYGFKQVASS